MIERCIMVSEIFRCVIFKMGWEGGWGREGDGGVIKRRQFSVQLDTPQRLHKYHLLICSKVAN